MAYSTFLRMYFSVSLPLLMLILLTMEFGSLALDVTAANPAPRVGGVLKLPSAGPSVSSAETFSSEVLFNQYTVLDKTSWNTLGDQVKYLDKWFGKPITSFTIGEDKLIGESPTSDSVCVHTPPYMNLIYISSKRTTAAVRSSSAITTSKNAQITSDDAVQPHTTSASRVAVGQEQPQKDASLRSSYIDHIERTNQGILKNSVIAPLRLHPLTPWKPTTLGCLQNEAHEALVYHEAQLHGQQRGENKPFVNAQIQETIIATNEYNTMIPITLYGTGTTIVSFKGHKDYVINVVLQLRGHRYESPGSEYNCENTRITAQLRSSTSPVYREDQKGTSKHSSKRVKAPPSKAHQLQDTDDPDEVYESNQNRVWSSFAQLFDTSLLCEVLPSLSLRIPKVKEERDFSFIIQSNVQPLVQNRFVGRDGILDQSNICSIQVYISQTPAKQLKMNQIIFAVLIPFLVLFVPLPFFLRRADIIQVASLGIDIVDCIWYPPYLLRRIIITGTIHLKAVVQTAWHQRRRRALQKRLELQQRALSARMNAAMTEAQNDLCRRCAPPQKGVDIPLGFPIQPQQAGIASSSSVLASPEVTATANESFPNECGKKGSSVILVDQPIRKLDEGDESSRDELSRPVAISDPSPTVVVVNSASHAIPNEALPPRLHREYDEAEYVSGDLSSPALLGKQGIVDGTPTRRASAAPCTTRVNGPTSQELLFATDSCREGGGGDIDEDERFCRICRDGEEDEALAAPCNCTGSVRWVHPSCLDHWRVESIKRNMNNVNTCEICKSAFKIKIRRSTLIWQSCKSIVYTIILIIACLICFMVTPLIAYGIFGEASCVAEYHHVPYSIIYKLDGVMLSFFLYVEIVLSVLLARLIVYSWFRSSAEVEAYVAEVHVVPRFMTWRNVLKIALVTIVIIAQAISLGYLIKYFMYVTSDIAWNWEASPLLGGIVFALFIFLAIGVSVSLREQWMQARINQGRSVAADVVVEVLNDSSGPRVSLGVEGTGVTETRTDLESHSASLGGGSTNGNQGGIAGPPLQDSRNNSFPHRRPPLQHRSTLTFPSQ
ncbi:unnamed protein product [Phytomonas sp. EM1]|nr:unnamed protein product [Phytomonas sp. EM1]|eukprot:CCW65182.1 unnamed protein product [Phytomonas sp. isolate EM1]